MKQHILLHNNHFFNMLKEELRNTNSYYLKKIMKYKCIFLISAGLALICSWITYPGILYSDSYGRIDMAKSIMNTFTSWLTPTPSYFIAISLFLTGDIALYTFFQAFLFFAVTLLIIARFASAYRKLQLAIVCLLPLFWGVSVYYEAGIGCVTGITALILFFSVIHQNKTKGDRVFEIIGIVFFSFITFGYRANAFTVLPVLLGYIIITRWKVTEKLMASISLITGLLLVPLCAKFLLIDTMSSKTAGFVWDSLKIIEQLEPEKQQLYMTFFDDIGGRGATARALEMNSKTSINGFIWESPLNLNVISRDGVFKTVIKKYFYLAEHETDFFLKVKWDSVSRTLGIKCRLAFVEYDYDRWGRMSEFHFSDTKARALFIDTYSGFCNLTGGYTLRPFIVFLSSGFFVLLSFMFKHKNRGYYLLIFLVAVFYYGAFLINTQSYEIRYFYPSLYLMVCINMMIAFNQAEIIAQKIRKNNK